VEALDLPRDKLVVPIEESSPPRIAVIVRVGTV
jgi:hypothetical protein